VVKRDQLMWIDGKEIAAADGSTFEVENPATGRMVTGCPVAGQAGVRAPASPHPAVRAAQARASAGAAGFRGHSWSVSAMSGFG
jgi:acyl-CoA reductase-like NAD-dependent aldehyde dehydrogenase